jgi:hypothetical protein
MSRVGMHPSRVALVGAIALGCITTWQVPARAGSDNSNDTYAGDVTLFSLPPGTLIASEYVGFRHGDTYVTSDKNIFGKLTGGQKEIPSTVDVHTSISRLTYLTSLLGHPLAISAAAALAEVDEFNIGNLPHPVGGLGSQTIGNSFTDPSVFVSYGLIVNPQNQRFLSFSNYVYFPAGNFDKFKQINFSTPGQYTWVPQLTYAEGLGKFGAKNLWLDLIANISVHSTGDSPLALAPGVQFDKLTQGNSYDIKAFLRYSLNPLSYAALGVERSWGGDQIATGGVLETIFGGPTSFGRDDFVKGHVQAAMGLARDFQIATDITHDFERSGGVREEFTAEVRLTKFFIPVSEGLK